jgi:hypothetical protein
MVKKKTNPIYLMGFSCVIKFRYRTGLAETTHERTNRQRSGRRNANRSPERYTHQEDRARRMPASLKRYNPDQSSEPQPSLTRLKERQGTIMEN